MHALNEILKAIELLPEADRAKLRDHLEQHAGDDDVVIQRLRAAGLKVHSPRSVSDDPEAKRLPPLKVPGEPVSEQIMRERR